MGLCLWSGSIAWPHKRKERLSQDGSLCDNDDEDRGLAYVQRELQVVWFIDRFQMEEIEKGKIFSERNVRAKIQQVD
jgi:hypothetical protein